MKRAYDDAITVLTTTVEKSRFYFLHQVYHALTSTSLIFTALAEMCPNSYFLKSL